MRILGVDSSLTGCGLARIDVTLPPASKIDSTTADEILVCTVKAPGPKLKTRREYSRRIAHVVDRVEAAMEDVDLIVIEDLAYGARGSSAFVLPWLWGRIHDSAEKLDRPIVKVGLSQIKKYATGKGNADKDMVIAAMVRNFPAVNITNDNESDALCAALIGCRAMGFPIDHPTVKKEEVMKALEAVERG